MAYISNKLCHFVGRSLKNDTERVKLLSNIIQSGKLLANPQSPGKKPEMSTDSTYKQADDLGEIFSHIDCVCFCDIPDSELYIHTKKYSKVGLAFTKKFLVSAGARPVQYVPLGFDMKKQMEGCIASENPKKYFVEINRVMIYTLLLMDLLNIENNDLLKLFADMKNSSKFVKQAAIHIEFNLPELFSGTPLHNIIYTLSQHTANSNAYIKLFDPCLNDDDINNYYMEREWRSLQNIDFSRDDIVSIYLPDNKDLINYFANQFPQLEDKIISIP